MNGYVEAGYLVVFASQGTYWVSLVGSERAARRRIEAGTRSAAGATLTGTEQDRSDNADVPRASVPVTSGRPTATGDDDGPGAVP